MDWIYNKKKTTAKDDFMSFDLNTWRMELIYWEYGVPDLEAKMGQFGK